MVSWLFLSVWEYSHVIEIKTNKGCPRRKVHSTSLSHFPVMGYWEEWNIRLLTVHIDVIWASSGESYVFDGGTFRPSYGLIKIWSLKNKWVWGVFSVIWIWPRECLFHELDYSLRFLDKIVILLGVYKLHNLAIGDCSSDSSPIQVFVQKSCLAAMLYGVM